MLVVGSIFFLSVWRKDVWAQHSGRSGSDRQALVEWEGQEFSSG